MELNTRLVDYPTGKAIKRINLPNDGALPNASKARIARTCSQVIELRCDQRRSRTRPRSSGTCFGTGVPASDHDDIVGAVVTLEGVQLHRRGCWGYANLESAATVARDLLLRNSH